MLFPANLIHFLQLTIVKIMDTIPKKSKTDNINGFVGLELPSSHSGLIRCVGSCGFCSNCFPQLPQLPSAIQLASGLDLSLLLSDRARTAGRGGAHQLGLQLSV